MEQKKSISKFWLYNFIPSKARYYLELIRFEKPIGFLLLMWPCWFTLALFFVKEIKWYLFFFIGSFCMRSVGCIINDYLDRSIDKLITRTSDRPLVSGKINFFEALVLLIILIIPSCFILLQFNFMAIILAIISIPLICIYPLMKRYTFWPQLVLGLVFSWGVIIASAQNQETLSLQTILMYIACIFWTLGYDTIYAYQDREDDIKINLKSTAILFKDHGKIIVMLFYCLFILFIFFSKNYFDLKLFDFSILIAFLIFLILFINKWKIDSPKSSNFYFKSNNYIGLLIFLYLIS